MPAELVNTLLILGAGQGLFLALLLASQRINSTANRILAVAMVAFALFILEGVYYARGFHLLYPHGIGISVPLTYLFGPIIYLYALVVTHGGHTFHRRWLLHFIPYAGVTLWLLPFYLSSGAEKLAYIQRLEAVGPPRDLAIITSVQYPHGIIYVALTFVVLHRHAARIRDNFSATEHLTLSWLRNLLLGTAGVWAVAIGLALRELSGSPMTDFQHHLTPLALSCLVYAVGYMALRQPEILRHATAPAVGDPADITDRAPRAEEAGGYGKSGLTEAEARSRMEQLQRLMTEKQPYKRSQLTLQELADEMAISTHNLSQVINTQGGKSFYDFVNGYRAEEAMRRLRDAKSAHLTILAIAEESGFNSKATFNAFFKRHAGVTPSQFRSAPT